MFTMQSTVKYKSMVGVLLSRNVQFKDPHGARRDRTDEKTPSQQKSNPHPKVGPPAYLAPVVGTHDASLADAGYCYMPSLAPAGRLQV
jgi:hypothetical protein